MGKSQKSNEKQLKGLILSRFFFVLVIVSMVELIVVALTNTYLIPNLVKIMKYDSVIQVNGAEGLFIIVFVLLMTLVANKIFPTLKISPVDVNNFLEGILVRHGFYGTDAAEATETIRIITEHPTVLLSLIGSFLLVVLILITPYVIGGIAYAISIAKSIRRFEREKEIERRKEEERRYLMISNIVHDLKTPMTTVYGYAKALNDGVVPKGKEAEYHEAIMNKTNRMNEVIALLLDYVKLDSEGFQIKKTRIDICELVRSCCALCYTDVESAGDEIDIIIPEKPLYINADKVQFSRVITNLITNAIRHNPDGTKIGVILKCESMTTAEDIRIFIADSGPVIPSPLCSQIFEPFVTGDESRATGSGTGLGLAISGRICEMHGYTLKLVQDPEIFRYHLDNGYKKVFVISM